MPLPAFCSTHEFTVYGIIPAMGGTATDLEGALRFVQQEQQKAFHLSNGEYVRRFVEMSAADIRAVLLGGNREGNCGFVHFVRRGDSDVTPVPPADPALAPTHEEALLRGGCEQLDYAMV